MMLEPLGEVGANFSLQLSSRTQFTKINNKKDSAENQCEKHKKSSLVSSADYLCKHQAGQDIGPDLNSNCFVCLFVLLLYIPSQQLWSCRDSQFN